MLGQPMIERPPRARAPKWQKIDDMPQRIAQIMVDGNPVAWFQGRMEFGPRALGGRSIIGCPSVPGVADRINEQIKFRAVSYTHLTLPTTPYV